MPLICDNKAYNYYRPQVFKTLTQFEFETMLVQVI